MSNWLTYSPTSGQGNGIITITADTLSELEERTATIVASNSQYGVSDSVLITQYKASPTLLTPLTFNILSAGTINWTASDASIAKTIDYKLNNNEWTSITSTRLGVAINVVEGDKIQFRGNNTQYATNSDYNSFGGSTASFEVEGNIMSLIYGDNFKDNSTINDYAFLGLFDYCLNLVSAQNLVLPATTLAQGCYRGMFSGCASLTTAPALPATTLADDCYVSMFHGCTSLKTAPELPATDLVYYCYYEMFRDCKSLNYIKCLATYTSASHCTTSWVKGVASTGMFVQNNAMTDWGIGDHGIPSGWTVTNAS